MVQKMLLELNEAVRRMPFEIARELKRGGGDNTEAKELKEVVDEKVTAALAFRPKKDKK